MIDAATGERVPFSQARADHLRDVVSGRSIAIDLGDGCNDTNFDRQYAAILLRERGL